jgi:hypothetical protein
LFGRSVEELDVSSGKMTKPKRNSDGRKEERKVWESEEPFL